MKTFNLVEIDPGLFAIMIDGEYSGSLSEDAPNGVWILSSEKLGFDGYVLWVYDEGMALAMAGDLIRESLFVAA